MAVILSQFRFNWHQLNDALNKIVDAINRNAPLPGDGISLDEKGQAGVAIIAAQQTSANEKQEEPWKYTPDGVLAGWQKVDAFNPNTGDVVPFWLWGGVPIAKGIAPVSWNNVTTVDPATCAESTIIVLIKQPPS